MVNIPTSYFGLLECFSCGAWFTKSGKFDHVWIPWDIFRPYGFMCSIPSHKKNETFVYSLLSSYFVSTEFQNLFPGSHRCRRLQMKVSHWRCLKWVSCQLFRCCFEAEVWPPCWLRWCIMISSFNSFAFCWIHTVPHLIIWSKFQWQRFMKVTCLPQLKCGVAL